MRSKRRLPRAMPKGLKKQIFGAMLLALGLVGVVLSGTWNSQPDLFDIVLIAGGIGLWLYGAFEKRRHRDRSPKAPPTSAVQPSPGKIPAAISKKNAPP